MVDPSYLQLDPRAAMWTVVRCFGMPLRPKEVPTTRYWRGGKGPRNIFSLALPVVFDAFSQASELAAPMFGKQEPQQNQDDHFMEELAIEEKHRVLRSF